MDTQILDGKKLAQTIGLQLKEIVQELPIAPKLSIIQVGHDPASTQYVNLKKKRGEEIGIRVTIHHLTEKETTSYEYITQLIERLSKETDGIIIQLPLPDNLESKTHELLDLIPTQIDVDGLNSQNLTQIRHNLARFLPAVVQGIWSIIQHYDLVKPESNIVILGDSDFVGTPVKDALQFHFPNNCINIINEQTTGISELLKNADVTVSCIGKPHIYNVDQLKPNSVLIDVGTSKHPETGTIVGDFDTTNASGYLTAYTPVPGGVGPMTVISLLMNTVTSCTRHLNLTMNA